MTLKKAIKIVMMAAERDVIGAGCGIRSIPSDTEVEKIRQALLRCGKYAYGPWFEIKT